MYNLGGRTVAIRRGGELTYLFQDHPSASLRTCLGSPALETDVDGNVVASHRYDPYGRIRGTEWTLPIDRGFTGQVIERGLDLHDYVARHYAQPLGRWIAPDTIVPDPGNPPSLNRYSYVYNRPLTHIDRDGQLPIFVVTALVGGLVAGGIAYVPQVYNNLQAGQSLQDATFNNIDWAKVGGATAGGVVAGGTLGVGTALEAGFVGTLALGGLGGALGGQTSAVTESGIRQFAAWSRGQRWNSSELFQDAFAAGLLDPSTIVYDVAGGSVSAGVGYGLGKVISPLLESYGTQVLRGGTNMIRLAPGKGGLEATITWEGRTIVLPASQLEEVLKAILAGSYDLASEVVQQIVDSWLQEQVQQQLGPGTP